MESDHNSQSSQNDDIVVFSIINPSVCSDCGDELTRGSFLKMDKQKPLCLECADLDHLVFLQSGDVALTRRSRKYSNLSAVVVKFSRPRRRYERQGLLVESEALARAEKECAGDEADRKLSRERAVVVRSALTKNTLRSLRRRSACIIPVVRLQRLNPSLNMRARNTVGG